MSSRSALPCRDQAACSERRPALRAVPDNGRTCVAGSDPTVQRRLGAPEGMRCRSGRQASASRDWTSEGLAWPRNAPCWLFALLVLTCLPAGARETAHFAIAVSENLIGFSRTSHEMATLDGQAAERLQSSVMLKLALLGEERTLRLDSETWLDRDSRRPRLYVLRSWNNETRQTLRCEIDGSTARLFREDGDGTGAAVEIDLPDRFVILGGNNFAHWQLMMDTVRETAEDGSATLQVLLPESGAVQTFRFTQKDQRTWEGLGRERPADAWQLEPDIGVLVDADTGELLQVDLQNQNSSITRTDAGVVALAEKAVAEEVLADRFVQSNVVFDDFLQVDSMRAQVTSTVLGSEAGDGNEALETRMQTFEGRNESGNVEGIFTIRSRPYGGEGGPPFPYPEAISSTQSKYLEPSTYIEADDPDIGARAASLVEGAETSWEATLRVAEWVHHEIRYRIADTPSARLALETRTGDCGPHSTLTVAMLRSAGIPARLVGGVVYTPTFGGSFGQHAWVEVYMGNDGWIALDPTTGEWDSMSATHIKLFEGIGGVLPESIRILEYSPQNRPPDPADDSAEPRPFAWDLDREHVFVYRADDETIGRETVVFEHRDDTGGLSVSSSLELSVGDTTLESRTTFDVDRRMRPVAFDRTLTANGTETRIQGTFEEGSASLQLAGSVNLEREIPTQPGDFLFDNNLMASLAVVCSQLELEEGTEVRIRTIHPSSLQIIPLTIKAEAVEMIAVGEEEIEAFRCAVEPIHNTFWITRDGRYLRAAQGNLVIELDGGN